MSGDRNGHSNHQRVMKQVNDMHQVPVHHTYIPTEAMTTVDAHVHVFMPCNFKLQATQISM